MYVAPVNAPVMRPAKELKGYDKRLIVKGCEERFVIHLGLEAFSYYDTQSHGWLVAPGQYKIYIGPSSAMTKLELEVTLPTLSTVGVASSSLVFRSNKMAISKRGCHFSFVPQKFVTCTRNKKISPTLIPSATKLNILLHSSMNSGSDSVSPTLRPIVI